MRADSLVGQSVEGGREDFDEAVLGAGDIGGEVLLREDPLDARNVDVASEESLFDDVLAVQLEVPHQVLVVLDPRHCDALVERVVRDRVVLARVLRHHFEGPVCRLPLDHGSLHRHRVEQVVVGGELHLADGAVVPLQHDQRLQGVRLVHVDEVAHELGLGAGRRQQVPSVRELELGGAPQHDFPVAVEFGAEDVEEPDFVGTAHGQVVARGVEGQTEQGVLDVLLLVVLIAEGELPHELAVGVFVVPDADSVVELGAGGDQGPLCADVHRSDGGPVEALEHVVEEYFLFLDSGAQGLEGVVLGRDDLGHLDGGDVVVPEGHHEHVLALVDVDEADLADPLVGDRPLAVEGERVLLEGLVQVLVLGPDREDAAVGADDEALREGADRSHHLLHRLREGVLDLPLDLVVALDYEDLALVRPDQHLVLLVPHVLREVAVLGQLVEGVVLHLEELLLHPQDLEQPLLPRYRDHVAVGRVYRDARYLLVPEGSLRVGPGLGDVDEHHDVVRLGRQRHHQLLLSWREGQRLERVAHHVRARHVLEYFFLPVPQQVVDGQLDCILVLQLLADRDLVLVGRYADALDRLQVVRESDVSRLVRLDRLLREVLPARVHHLALLLVLVDYRHAVRVLVAADRPEGVQQVQAQPLVLLRHQPLIVQLPSAIMGSVQEQQPVPQTQMWATAAEKPVLSQKLSALLALLEGVPPQSRLYRSTYIYEGQLKEGVLAGRCYLKEAVLIGKFRIGLEPKEGVLVTEKGIYEGELRAYQMCGQGTLTLVKGVKVFSQNWKRNKPSGRTIEFWADGDVFLGEMKEGRKECWGCYRGKGWTFEGVFEKNRMKEGVLRNAEVTFRGQFQEDCPKYGEVKYRSGARYRGDLSRGIRHGEGQLSLPTGEVIRGVWREGVLLRDTEQESGDDDQIVKSLQSGFE